jgi:hypothetical protein
MKYFISLNSPLFNISLRKSLGVTLGTLFAVLSLSQQSMALNGFTQVVPCTNCQAYSDFVTLAKGRAAALKSPGLYAISSVNYPLTSYISVTGTLVVETQIAGHPVVLTNIVGTPVDENGSPVSDPTYLNSLDQTTFGGDRTAPKGPLAVPDPDYATSFVCGCDLEDIGARIANWISIDMNTMGESLPIGSVVTFKKTRYRIGSNSCCGCCNCLASYSKRG